MTTVQRRTHSRWYVKLLLIGLVLAWTGSASAGTASFSVGSGGMVGDNGATASWGGVILPNASAPRASFNFFLPVDYVSNTQVTLVLYLHSASIDCDFVLIPTTVVQRRPGVAVDGDTSVFVAKNGMSTVGTPSSPTIPIKKIYYLNAGGTIATMKAGDQFLIAFTRNALAVEDTCVSDVYVEGVDIRYTTP